MDDMAVIPYSLDRAILGTAQLTHFSVKVDQSDHMDTVMAKLERFLGRPSTRAWGSMSWRTATPP